MSYTPIVNEFAEKLDKDSEFRSAMQASFDLAYSYRLREFDDFDIHSLDDYVRFMDQYVKWVPTETSGGRNVYLHICLFYFIIDLPPVRDFQNPIEPSQRAPWKWLTDWLIRYAQEMGTWMSTPESITPEAINTFYNAPAYHMQDYPVPPGGWTTFNDFFARHIDPAVRPVASPNDDTVIICPADCSFDGQWPVNDPGADVNTFDVKGVPWAINQLLDDPDSGTDYGSLFAGGIFTHSFLNTTDYHRQHAPVAGTVIEAKVIPGVCYLEVVLQPQSATDNGDVKLGMHRYIRHKDDSDIPSEHQGGLPSGTADGGSADIDAPDRPGYQFLQARGLILIDNPTLGLVAVLPIGMAQVSSVVLSVKAGDVLEKGQEISCFHLGGSDIVMVFQKGANVQFLDEEIGKHHNFGTAIATGGRG